MEKRFICLVLILVGIHFGFTQSPDAATVEFTAISDELIGQNKFAEAIPKLEALIQKYPTTALIDSIKFNLGLSYLFTQKNLKAFEVFTKLMEPRIPIELRESASFFVGLAKSYDSFAKEGAERAKGVEAAVKLFSDFLANKEFEKSIYREEVLFQRTKLYLLLEKFDDVQKGIDQLHKEFQNSPNHADHDLTLGQSYMLQTFRMIQDQKKSREEAMPTAQKGFDAFAKIKQSDSAVVANDALFKTAELKNLLADNEEEFRALLVAYRLVKPKNELIPLQEALVNGIKKEKQAAALSKNYTLIKSLDLRLNKERDRLEQLTNLFDPAVQSMVQMGKTYVRLKEANEARVLLRRAKVFCKEEQKKEISYFIILTYAMQGSIDKADKGFVDYQKEFPNDPQADNISILIGEELFKQKNYDAAFAQYEKSVRDYPKGRYADLASMRSAACKVQQKKTEEGIKILQTFVINKKESPYIVEALLSLVQAFTDLKQPEDVLKIYQTIVATPSAASAHPESQYKIAETLRTLKRYDEAIAAWKVFREKYSSNVLVSQALLAMADSTFKKGDIPGALVLFEQSVKDYADKPEIAVVALSAIADIYQKQQKTTDMIAVLERVIKDYATQPKANDAAGKLASYYEQQRQYDLAEKYYQAIISKKSPEATSWAEFRLGAMYYKAGLSIGAYSALNEEEKGKWNGFIKKSEEAQLRILKEYPNAKEVGSAIQELLKLTITKTDAGLIKVEEAQGVFKSLATQFSSNEGLQGRILLAGAGISYEKGNPVKALESYEEIQKQFPKVIFAAEDLNRYGSALISSKSYAKSFEVFKQLSEKFPGDKYAEANALYGMGASVLFQNRVEEAAKYFEELKVKAPWSSKIIEAELGIGLAAELAAKSDNALKSYKAVAMNPKSTSELKARATLGRGRIFEMMGMLLPDPAKKDQPSASMEFDRVASLYGAEKEEASEALYRLGLIYMKNGKVEEGKAALKKCVEKYPGSQWATQASTKLQ